MLVSVLFSEPKIPQRPWRRPRTAVSGFQCSSASRKFLNRSTSRVPTRSERFQCSSASRKFLNPRRSTSTTQRVCVSVLFSEPKIPQLWSGYRSFVKRGKVSVLFSEPKIPQHAQPRGAQHDICRFQCSSASRKFLNCSRASRPPSANVFQCSSASRKFLNRTTTTRQQRSRRSFSALQRAENSSTLAGVPL